jgi:hypothetical protein
MIPGIVAGYQNAPQFEYSTDLGVLAAVANDNGTAQAFPASGNGIGYGYTAYDPLAVGWRDHAHGNHVLQVPNDSRINLIRLIGAVYTSLNLRMVQHRKWNGVSTAAFVGAGTARTNRSAVGGVNNGNLHSAILAVSPGDLFDQAVTTGAGGNMINGGTRNFFSAEVIPPGTRYTFVARTAAQVFAANTETAIIFDDASDIVDTLGTHDPTTNPQNFVIQAGTTGKIRVSAWAQAGSSGAGLMELRVKKNGVTQAYANHNQGAATSSGNVVSQIIDVVATDIITFTVKHPGATGISASGAWICIEEIPADHRYCLVAKSSNEAMGSPANIAWNGVDIHDPEGAHNPAVNNHLITIPADAEEYRLSYGFIATTAGLAYTAQPPNYWPGYAGDANGTLVFNALGPWNTTSGSNQERIEVFGVGTVNFTGAYTFFQAEWR